MNRVEITAAIVLGVAGLALFLRTLSSRGPAPMPAAEDVAREDAQEGAGALEAAGRREPEAEERVAVTSDGWAFMPDDEEVQLIPPGAIPDIWPVKSPTVADFSSIALIRSVPLDPVTRRTMAAWKPGEHLDRGDLVAVRLVRGDPDFDPWRLEALGREGEYRCWRFDGEEAARGALALLERRVLPVHRRGATDADFEHARQRTRETERWLTLPDENWTTSIAGGEWLSRP